MRIHIAGFALLSISTTGWSQVLSQPSLLLRNPALKEHAKLPQNNLPGVSLRYRLAQARVDAPLNGVKFDGLDIEVSDSEATSPHEPMEVALLRKLKQLACEADAVVLGSVVESAYHLSSLETTIYGDHIFMVETVLKNDAVRLLRPKSQIVVTRPGGSAVLPEGKVKFEFKGFPYLRPDSSYVLFLKKVPDTGSYQSIDRFSTLIRGAVQWTFARAMFSRMTIHELSNESFEENVRQWIRSCK